MAMSESMLATATLIAFSTWNISKKSRAGE